MDNLERWEMNPGLGDLLPQPPWEGLPVPGVIREILGLTGEERITISKQSFLAFVHGVRDLGYGPTMADAKKLMDQWSSHLTEEELDNLDLLYSLWIAAENPEEAGRYGLL